MRISEFFRICKALLLNRRKNTADKYIRGIETIDSFIEAGLISIEPEQPNVLISSSLHTYYAHSDKRYCAFFEHIRAWINMQRGMDAEHISFCAESTPISFVVVGRQRSIIIAGCYVFGRIEYGTI